MMETKKRRSVDNCPFCNSQALLTVSDKENGDTTRQHTIYCSDIFGCGAQMVTYLSYWSRHYNEEVDDFIKRWNTRIK